MADLVELIRILELYGNSLPQAEFYGTPACWINTGDRCKSTHAICLLDLRLHFGMQFGDIGVDHFKLFNDTHGHLAGDDALRHIAEVLSTTARETDEVFRYGGEEFAVLLSDIRQDQVFPTAERIRSEVEQAHFLLPNGDNESITVSIGAAGLASGFSFNDIVERADKALYQAKVAGRNKVIIAKS